MIEIGAVFVACQLNLLICFDLPFLRDKHLFEDTDKCRAYVEQVVEIKSDLRRMSNHPFPVVMGKCRTYINENSGASIL